MLQAWGNKEFRAIELTRWILLQNNQHIFWKAKNDLEREGLMVVKGVTSGQSIIFFLNKEKKLGPVSNKLAEVHEEIRCLKKRGAKLLAEIQREFDVANHKIHGELVRIRAAAESLAVAQVKCVQKANKYHRRLRALRKRQERRFNELAQLLSDQ
jgi:hypothetical protein